MNIWKRLRDIACSPSDEENLGQQRAHNEVDEFNNEDLAATERLQLVIRRIRTPYSHLSNVVNEEYGERCYWYSLLQCMVGIPMLPQTS